MQITSLKIKNFLALGDVEIRPGHVTQITGQNNQGKTSIIKALNFAVKGSNDPSMVKLGEEAAEVLLELSDSTLIRRRLNSEGRQSVTVERDGMKAKSPQSLLDALFDQSSFNPLELLDSEKRTETILRSIELKVTPESLAEALRIDKADLPPCDYSAHGLKVLEATHKYFYQRRAEANRVAMEKKHRFETYKRDLPDRREKPSLNRDEIKMYRDELNAKLGEYREKNQQLGAKIEARISALDQVARLERERLSIMREYEEQCERARFLGERLERVTERIVDAKMEVPAETETPDKLKDQVSACKEDISKLDLVESEWAAVDAEDKQRRMVQSIGGEFNQAQEFADSVDTLVKSFDGIRADMMSKAEMPVEGLTFQDGEFFVNGFAVNNLSSSRALVLAINVARKLAKKAKVICIDGAEQLDERSWEALCEEIRDDGFTYFVTRVGSNFHRSTAPDDQVLIMSNGQVVQ